MLKKIALTLCVAFTLWIAISFVEIVSKNDTTKPVYSGYNFFSVATCGSSLKDR